MLTKQVEGSLCPQTYRLVNFAVTCICGQTYKFTELDDIKICKCGRDVKLSSALKEILIKNGSAKPINVTHEVVS